MTEGNWCKMASLYSFTIIAIIPIVITNSETNEARILGIFPLNWKSYFVMCELLMKTLAKKGHQVDVISHFPLERPFPNYKDFSVEGTLPNIQNNMTYKTFQSLSGFSLKEFIDSTGNAICKLIKHPVINNIIQNPPNDHPYDLVIVEVRCINC